MVWIIFQAWVLSHFGVKTRTSGTSEPSSAVVVLEQFAEPCGAMLLLDDDRYLVVSANGHYRGSPEVQKDIVYVVQTETAQELLTPDEFAKKYGWRNDPTKVNLMYSPGNGR